MESPPEPLVQIENNFPEMFGIMPSITIAQMVPLLPKKMAARALDKKYLKMTPIPEPVAQNQNNFTEILMILVMPSKNF